jgi:hypothetical protein
VLSAVKERQATEQQLATLRKQRLLMCVPHPSPKLTPFFGVRPRCMLLYRTKERDAREKECQDAQFAFRREYDRHVHVEKEVHRPASGFGSRVYWLIQSVCLFALGPRTGRPA